MRFRLDHPLRPRARCHYGFDHALGFWVELRGDGLHDNYDRTVPGYAGLNGALAAIAGAGFFQMLDLQTGLLRSEHEHQHDLPRRQRAAVEVVSNFKSAADR